MARIHQPRQRVSDGRWDYTVSSDEEGWAHATGYCVGWEDPEEQDKRAESNDWPKLPQEYREKLLKFKDKFHSDGHATSAEAAECNLQYELDFEVRTHTAKDQQHKCHECGEWTQDQVEVGPFHHFWLCKPHQSRETLEKLVRRKHA